MRSGPVSRISLGMARTRGLIEVAMCFIILASGAAFHPGGAFDVIGYIAAFLFMADGLRVLFVGSKRRDAAAERALTVEAAHMAAALAPRCPECQGKLEPAVMTCGACGATVRKKCAGCGRPMLLDAEACMFCGSREFK